MKNILRSVLLMAATSVTLFSCNNGDYTATPPGGTTWNGGGSGTSTGTISAKINGTQWSGVGACVLSGTVAQIGGGTGSQVMSIIITGFNGAATYNFTATTTANWISGAGTTPVASTSGSVTVTSYQNNQIQGTFNWAGTSLNVTNGTFNVPVQ